MIVDIDGTVAMHVDSEGNLLRGHYQYDLVSDDLPNPPVIDLVTRLLAASLFLPDDATVLFVTGRSDALDGKVRKDTHEWLEKHVFYVAPDELFMRKEFLDGTTKPDYRPDYIVKEEIYHQRIEPNFDVLYAIDDRQQVVDMWRSLGITCFQCAPGNF